MTGAAARAGAAPQPIPRGGAARPAIGPAAAQNVECVADVGLAARQRPAMVPQRSGGQTRAEPGTLVRDDASLRFKVDRLSETG